MRREIEIPTHRIDVSKKRVNNLSLSEDYSVKRGSSFKRFKIGYNFTRQRTVKVMGGTVGDITTILTPPQIVNGGGGGSDYVSTVIGILLADPRQPNVKEYLFNYLDILDARSGDSFNLYIPGYRKADETIDDKDICYRVGNVKDGLVLDYSLFVGFINDMEAKMNVKYTFNPMFVLVSAWYNHLSGKTEFRDDCYVIQLDKVPGGIQRSGEMFDVVFDVAKKNTQDMDAYKGGVRMKYVKATAAKLIIDSLTTKGIIGKVISLGKDVYELLPSQL